jgi:hypothetical protein
VIREVRGRVFAIARKLFTIGGGWTGGREVIGGLSGWEEGFWSLLPGWNPIRGSQSLAPQDRWYRCARPPATLAFIPPGWVDRGLLRPNDAGEWVADTVATSAIPER